MEVERPPIEKEKLIVLLRKLFAAWGRNLDVEAGVAYSEALEGITLASIEYAVNSLIKSGRDYLPPAGLVREAALDHQDFQRLSNPRPSAVQQDDEFSSPEAKSFVTEHGDLVRSVLAEIDRREKERRRDNEPLAYNRRILSQDEFDAILRKDFAKRDMNDKRVPRTKWERECYAGFVRREIKRGLMK